MKVNYHISKLKKSNHIILSIDANKAFDKIRKVTEKKETSAYILSTSRGVCISVKIALTDLKQEIIISIHFNYVNVFQVKAFLIIKIMKIPHAYTIAGVEMLERFKSLWAGWGP